MIFCLKFETKGSVSLRFSDDMQIMWSVKNWMMASPLLKLLKLLKLGHRGTFRKKENCNSLNILRTKSPQRASFKNDIVIVLLIVHTFHQLSIQTKGCVVRVSAKEFIAKLEHIWPNPGLLTADFYDLLESNSTWNKSRRLNEDESHVGTIQK